MALDEFLNDSYLYNATPMTLVLGDAQIISAVQHPAAETKRIRVLVSIPNNGMHNVAYSGPNADAFIAAMGVREAGQLAGKHVKALYVAGGDHFEERPSEAPSGVYSLKPL
jgi:hypothetical protein